MPKRIDTILISTQHLEEVTMDRLKKDLIEKVINVVVPKEMMDENTKIYINPTGRFVRRYRINRKKNYSRYLWWI